MFKKPIFMIAGVVGLAIAGLLLFKQSRLRDPKVAVESYFDCFERRDGDCVRALTREDERKNAPTAEQMRDFMAKVVVPRMSGFEPVGPIMYEAGLDPAAQAFGSRRYRHLDGREISLGSSGHATEGKAVCWPNFAYLVLGTCQTYARAGEVPSSRVVLERGLRELKPVMESMGIRGAFLNTDEAERFYTWEEWIGRIQAKET